ITLWRNAQCKQPGAGPHCSPGARPGARVDEGATKGPSRGPKAGSAPADQARGDHWIAAGPGKVFLLLLVQHAVHLQPRNPCLEPAGAGGVLLVHAEAVATTLVVVELHRAAGLLPAFDQAEALVV